MNTILKENLREDFYIRLFLSDLSKWQNLINRSRNQAILRTSKKINQFLRAKTTKSTRINKTKTMINHRIRI